MIIKVPVGTLLKDKNDNILYDLANKKSEFIVARGGAGGKGNYYFMTNTKRDPVDFENGHIGQELLFNIELNLVADAALVNITLMNN